MTLKHRCQPELV